MSAAPGAHPLRERLLAFYRHYCPEKPSSHVDFLLSKYAGNEEAVLEVLREKYGPEPTEALPRSDHDRVAAMLRSPEAASALVDQFKGQEARLRHDLVDRYGAEPHLRVGARSARPDSSYALGSPGRDGVSSSDDLERALQSKRQQFERDMAQLKAHEEQRRVAETLSAVTEAKLELQRQEVELQQLRIALSASKASGFANQAQHDEAIKRVAQQLTRAKLQLLTMKSDLDPDRVAASRLDAVVSETAKVEEQMHQSVQYCRCLAEAVRRHLRAYPLSPMHGTLREADPAMCARLEQ
uniref:Uncharacterized protein n=1 Tax=Neobodo designis TaxID=312471 RepID=A0A7S1PZ58_NEODS